ncbi:hypothetical protein D3C86_1370510 [compost metagenome]
MKIYLCIRAAVRLDQQHRFVTDHHDVDKLLAVGGFYRVEVNAATRIDTLEKEGDAQFLRVPWIFAMQCEARERSSTMETMTALACVQDREVFWLQ